jgi:hypothetical protein
VDFLGFSKFVNLQSQLVYHYSTGGALCKPGINAAVGDVLTHINRVRLTQEVAPAELLVGKGGAEVMLTFTVGDGPRRPAAEIMAGSGGELAARIGSMSLEKGGGGGGGGKNKNKKGGGGGGGGGKGQQSGGKRGGANAGHKGGGHGGGAALPPTTPATPSSVVPRKPGQSVNVRIRAMHSELDARYRDMVRRRTQIVASSGAGRVGYLHLPDMERTGWG